MGISDDTLFVYRFDRPVDRIYGPRALSWVIATYGARPECECAPATADGSAAAGPWRPVGAWQSEMLPKTASERQRKRLAKLGVLHDPGTLGLDDAARLIAEAEACLSPTKHQLAKAVKLGVAVPPAATRAALRSLTDAAERRAAVRGLHAQGVPLAEDASWDEIRAAEDEAQERSEAFPLIAALRRQGVVATDEMSLEELDELDSARRDLDEAMRDARRLGFKFEPSTPLTLVTMQALYASLGELEQHLASSEANLDWLVERGRLPRKPRRAAIKIALPDQFARIHAGTWQGNDEDDLWFFQRALELQEALLPRATDQSSPGGL